LDGPNPLGGSPVNPWLYEEMSWTLWVVCFVVLSIESWRSGRVNRWLLLLFAFTTLWWQDTFGGWGVYFLYNPEFVLMEFWGPMPYTSPYKPWFLVASYGWWWTVSIGLSYIVMVKLREKKPNWSFTTAFMLTIGPFFYIFDLVLETAFVANHWQNYTQPVGPAVVNDAGNFPLIWPLLPQIWWIYAVVWMVYSTNASGENRFEAWLGLDKMEGAKLQWARLGAYTVYLNLSYFFLMIGPLMLVRILFGGPSDLVP
jgi:hypothetical protein